jgi:hypothetical protein
LEFTDINYAVASPEEQSALFVRYRELLNSTPPECVTKISIVNTPNVGGVRRDILLPEQSDGLNGYRAEYNVMLDEKSKYGNGVSQHKYITISSERRNEKEARAFFSRICTELAGSFRALGAALREITIEERLQIFGDFFNGSLDNRDLAQVMSITARGHDFRDLICPYRLKFNADYFELDNRFGRVLFLRGYPTYLKDSMLTDMTSSVSVPLSLSVDILPTPTEEAVKETQSKILQVESDITRFQQRQNRANNFSAVVPYTLQASREDAKEFLDDLIGRDQRMMFALVTLVHIADTKEQLDADTENFISIGAKYLCEFATLKYQQEDALNTALPYGIRPIETLRTLTTESAAALMPFNARELMQPGGIYYGTHAVSKNLIIADRMSALNANGCIFGTSGSGKSFAAKCEMISIALSRLRDNICIIDPSGEYSELVRALGGEVITIASGGKAYINALDLVDTADTDADPIAVKAEFVMSLCEQILNGSLGAKEKSIVDRVIAKLYHQSYEKNIVPILPDFRAILTEQPEPEAKSLATAIELFTNGSLDMFAKPTNVNTGSRIISYTMKGMGQHLRPVAMLVVLDAIQNRVALNRTKGISTWIYIDEFHLYFRYQYSAEFLLTCWKTFRKMGAPLTGITQNIEECLTSNQARLMLSNSEFLLMLNQSATDRVKLAELLRIPEAQMAYVTDADTGCGLLKSGSALIPFRNEFPKGALYNLMTTKPQDAFDE